VELFFAKKQAKFFMGSGLRIGLEVFGGWEKFKVIHKSCVRKFRVGSE